MLAGVVQPEHGTYRTYINYACRCQPCKAANAQYMRDWRDVPGPPPQHGLSGYSNWRCRCEICTGAKAEYNRQYQRARRVKAR